MNAREILEAQQVPEDVIDGILCVHAHELAEKIRAHDKTEPGHLAYPQPWRDGRSDGIQDAAALIDPEVADSGA